MGWTHRAGAEMLRRYPGYENIPMLMERWPALREAVEKLRSQQSGSDNPTPDTPKE